MAGDRLFIYDPTRKKAVCIAKGYSTGWTNGKGDYIDKWLEDTIEYVYDINFRTRLQLKTEGDLPSDTDITYET